MELDDDDDNEASALTCIKHVTFLCKRWANDVFKVSQVTYQIYIQLMLCIMRLMLKILNRIKSSFLSCSFHANFYVGLKFFFRKTICGKVFFKFGNYV